LQIGNRSFKAKRKTEKKFNYLWFAVGALLEQSHHGVVSDMNDFLSLKAKKIIYL